MSVVAWVCWCRTRHAPSVMKCPTCGHELSDVNAEVTVEKRCAICPQAVTYQGPVGLAEGALVFCGETCERIWDAITPGEWIDAAELLPGGSLHERPEIWTEDKP